MSKLITLFLMLGLYQPATVTYTNTGNKFKMDYPNNWVQKDNGNTILFLSPKENSSDTFQENVNVMLQDLTGQGIDLEKYIDITKKQITENVGPSAQMTIKDISFSGQKAKEIIFNMNYSGRNLKVKQYVFIKLNLAYLFTYTAEQSKFDKYEPVSTTLINSFRFF